MQIFFSINFHFSNHNGHPWVLSHDIYHHCPDLWVCYTVSSKHLLITHNFYYLKLHRLNHHLNEWYNLVNYLGINPYTFLRKSSALIYAHLVHADSSTRHHHGETCNVSINHIIPHLNPWFVKLDIRQSAILSGYLPPFFILVTSLYTQCNIMRSTILLRSRYFTVSLWLSSSQIS